MPSNINIQLAEFQQFVDFAEAAAKAGKQRAVARDEEAAQFSRFGGNGPGFISV